MYLQSCHKSADKKIYKNVYGYRNMLNSEKLIAPIQDGMVQKANRK